MKKDIALYILTEAAEPIFVFDGDKQPKVDEKKGESLHIDPRLLPAGELTLEKLDALIKKQTGIEVKFHEDSRMSDEKKIKFRIDYLNYYKDHVYYTPFHTPEQAIWNERACRSLIEVAIGTGDRVDLAFSEVASMTDYKKRYVALSHLTDQSLDSIHKVFLKRFSEDQNASWTSLIDLLRNIESHA